jgi:hypothetical protein
LWHDFHVRFRSETLPSNLHNAEGPEFPALRS